MIRTTNRSAGFGTVVPGDFPMTATRLAALTATAVALEDIRSEVVSISVAAAAKIIGHNIDEKINSRLVDDFITRMDAGKQGGTPPC